MLLLVDKVSKCKFSIDNPNFNKVTFRNNLLRLACCPTIAIATRPPSGEGMLLVIVVAWLLGWNYYSLQLDGA